MNTAGRPGTGIELELDDLKATHVSNQLSLQTSPLGKFCQPPPEILHMIFERTLPPNFLLDPSAITSPMSLWSKVSRQKKSLINVCRAWYQVGLPFLYEDIVIFYIPQFLRLLRTLIARDPDFKHLIKSISLYCTITDHSGSLFEDKLNLFFSLCPGTKSFTFRPRLEYYVPFLTIPSANITHLSLDNISIELMKKILRQMASSLISLSVGAFWFPLYLSTELDDPHDPLCLPCLEELTICDFMQFNWTLPRINHLTILQYVGDYMFLNQILLKHGSKLKILHMSPKSARLLSESSLLEYDFGTALQKLSTLCPVLEHIVLHPSIFAEGLTHPNIKWADIWEPLPPGLPPSKPQEYIFVPGLEWQALRKSITKDRFPSLQAVRQISSAFYSFPNIPTDFPPGQVLSPSDAFAYTFVDLDVHHDVGRIYGDIAPLTIYWPEGYTSSTPFSCHFYLEPVMMEGNEEEEESSSEDDDSDSSDSDYLESSTISSSSDSEISDATDLIDWEITPGEEGPVVSIEDVEIGLLVE